MFYRVVTFTSLLLLAAPNTPLTAAGAAEISIRGHVLGPDGEPRSKVEVVLEPTPSAYERARLRLAGRPGPEPVARTRTDGDGAFELGAPAAGMWTLVVSAPKLLTMERRLTPLVEETVLPPVELVPTTELEVRVVDARGKPRPGVVGAYALDVRSGSWIPRLRLTTAGEDGIARLPLGRDEKIQLEVRADGHPLVVSEVSDETSVTVEAPAGVAGVSRVAGSRKRPVVAAIAFQGSALLPFGLTDDEGHFAWVVQVENPRALHVLTADRWSRSFVPEIDGGSTKTRPTIREVRLEPPTTVRGRVLDLADRDPIADALVWAVRGEFAVTDKQGGYELDIALYKPRSVGAAAAGYLWDYAPLNDSTDDQSLAIALMPAAVLSGRVADVEGNALEGVAISLQLAPRASRPPSAARRAISNNRRARTSRQGTFQIVGLPANLTTQLTCQAEGFAPQQLTVEPIEPFEHRSRLEVVMSKGRRAFGWVVNDGDEPIADAEVRLVPPPSTNDPRVARWMDHSRDDGRFPTVVTDVEGRFEVLDLADGQYDLEVVASGYAPARFPGLKVPADQQDETEVVDLGIVTMAQGAAIEGRVVDSEDTALSGVEIKVELPQRWVQRGSQSSRYQLTTGPGGQFVVTDLHPGQPVVVAASKSGYVSAELREVRPPTDEPLTIVLQTAGRLQGRVVNASGEPLASAKVLTYPDTRSQESSSGWRGWSRPLNTTTEADGRFLIEDVAPGTLWVSVEAKSYQGQTREGIEVAAGATTDLEFVLETGAVIEGTVTAVDGEPLLQASITVSESRDSLSPGSWNSVSSRIDADGRYRVAGVPVGPAKLVVFHRSTRGLTKTVEVRPGTQVIDLQLEPSFTVAGQVVAPDGTPVGDATIVIEVDSEYSVSHSRFYRSSVVSAADGAFTVTDVAAGHYKIAASRDGFAPATSETFEVASNVSGLLLQLSHGSTLKGRVLGLELDELGALSLVAYSSKGGARSGRVDFSGDYRFDQLAAGEWYVEARVSGSDRSLVLQIEIPEGDSEVEKDLEFKPGFTLSGIVLDNERPVAGVSVSAGGSVNNSGYDSTDADGRFSIGNLAVGTYMVRASTGIATQYVEEVELSGDRDLRIEIATGALSGTVRSAVDGEPLSGVRLGLELLDRSDDAEIPRHGLSNKLTTDSRGRFRATRIRPGKWRLVASRSGYAPGEASLSVTHGGTSEVEIQLTPTEGVTFDIALQSGAEVPSVQVSILDASGRHLSGGSHPVVEGRARVSTVPLGRWELVLQAGDSAATRWVVNSPGDQGRVYLPTAGSLQIKIPELEGEPRTKALLTGPDGKPFVYVGGTTFNPGEWHLRSGRAMVPGLTPGVWSFTVEHADGRSWSGSATVASGAMTEVVLP